MAGDGALDGTSMGVGIYAADAPPPVWDRVATRNLNYGGL
jgi:hypothetical protein